MTLSCGSPTECLQALGRWLHRRRRRLILLALIVAFFYALGYFAAPVNLPGMCKVYG